MAAARTLDQDVTAALHQTQALGSDPFEIGEFVRLQDPAYWYRVRSLWAGSAFPQVPLRTQVSVRISSVGDILCAVTGSR